MSRLRALISEDLIRQVAGASISTLILKVSSAGFNYLLFIALAQLMTVQAFGKFSFGFNLATFLAVVASIGVHVGITRWWPEYIAKNRPGRAAMALKWGGLVTLVGAILATALMVAGAEIASVLLDGDYDYLIVAALLIGPIAAAEYMANALRAQGSIFISQIPKDVAWRLLGCIAAGIFAWRRIEMDTNAAFMLLAAGLAIVILPQFAFLARSIRIFPHRDRGHAQTHSGLWLRTTMPLWGAAVLHAVVQYVDVVLVGLFLSPEASGEYFAVSRTANLMGLMLIASTMVSAPLISKYVHANDKVALQRLLRFIVILIAVPTLSLYAIVVAAGPLLLSLFDPSFVTGYPALVLLGFGYTFNALCGTVGYTLMLTGNEAIYLKIMTISYIGVFVVQVIGILSFGMIGAAIGTTMGMIVWNLWARYIAVKRVGIDSTFLSWFIPVRTAERQG